MAVERLAGLRGFSRLTSLNTISEGLAGLDQAHFLRLPPPTASQ